jgi:hypothetical protein
MWAKQSTAATLIVGPILDSAGAEYTSAVIGDLSISKNGGTLTALAAAATLTHIANGQYALVMTTGNLDTLGRLQITCNRATYQMPPIGLTVVPAMVFDSMVLGTDVLQSDTIQFGGTNGTFDAGKPTAVLDSASRLAIWNTLTTGTFTADSFGELLIISDGTNGREVKVTGAGHIAADIHDVQPDGLSGSTEIVAINTFATRVTTGLVVDGAVWQFTANMLELGPSGSSVVTVLPATGIVADRSAGVTLTPVVGETISQSITLYRTDGTTPVSLSGKTLAIVFETLAGVDVATVASGNITISGANSNVVTFAYPSAVTASERTLRFAIRDAAAPLTMYLQGVCSVVAAPKVDA